jgi:hypothetical protein
MLEGRLCSRGKAVCQRVAVEKLLRTSTIESAHEVVVSSKCNWRVTDAKSEVTDAKSERRVTDAESATSQEGSRQPRQVWLGTTSAPS